MIFKRRIKRSVRQIVVETVYPKGGWWRAVTYIIHRLRRLPDKPHRIARGVAAGIFVSFTPFLGFHLFIAAGLAWLMRGNMVAALLSTLVGNPLTFPLIMTVSVDTGNFLLHEPNTLHLPMIVRAFARASLELWENSKALVVGGTQHWESLEWFFRRVFWPYLIGGIVPGVVLGLVGYYLSLPVVAAYQKRRSKRLRDRVEKLRALKLARAEALRVRNAGTGQEG
ncbi:MAG: DUF2062 domain-containing protein [Rhodobacteraceae bacterium]|nr:DUF2062 domain-containing protein [Paracoccaceae bacterium]